jgi:hypothetical protein
LREGDRRQARPAGCRGLRFRRAPKLIGSLINPLGPCGLHIANFTSP